MKIEDLEKYKKVLIVGYGIEGKATHAFLQQLFPHTSIGIADRSLDGENYLDKQYEYDLVIKSPGIHKSLITVPYTTATNIFFANVKGTTIGITGSKGKSTTSTLIYAMLKQAGKDAHLVGNITHKMENVGQPMLTSLVKTNTSDDIWVIELSSYMLDDIQYSPHISVFTSFFPEHLDHHKTIEEYLQAKARIVAHATKDDYFVYNPHFKELQKIASTQAKAIPEIPILPFPQGDVPLLGQHNIDNVKLATTAVQLLGIKDVDIHTAVKQFIPLPHRLEFIGEYNGITFYDDAIATNPQATIHAINALENIGSIFLGGSERQSDFTDLARCIVEKKIPSLVFFPDCGEKIWQAIQKEIQTTKTDYHPTIMTTRSMQEAVAFAYSHTQKGSICILSTAAKSFSIWNNFEEKGNEFKKFVKEYASHNS